MKGCWSWTGLTHAYRKLGTKKEQRTRRNEIEIEEAKILHCFFVPLIIEFHSWNRVPQRYRSSADVIFDVHSLDAKYFVYQNLEDTKILQLMSYSVGTSTDKAIDTKHKKRDAILGSKNTVLFGGIFLLFVFRKETGEFKFNVDFLFGWTRHIQSGCLKIW